MRVINHRAAAVALEDAATYLQSGERAPIKVLLAIATLAEATDNPGPWSEADLAEMTGTSRHQVRQAIASLIASERLERSWDTSSGRPEPRYRVRVEQ